MAGIIAFLVGQVPKLNTMATNRFIIFIFISFQLGCIQPKQNQSISTDSSIIDSSYLANLTCRSINIDDVINDKELFENSALYLIDELPVEYINADSFARIIIANQIDTSLLINILNVGVCWQLTIKEIPENHFGVFPYLVQEKSIKYTASKKLVDSSIYRTINNIYNQKQESEIPNEADLQVSILELKSSKFIGRRFLSKDELDIILDLLYNEF